MVCNGLFVQVDKCSKAVRGALERLLLSPTLRLQLAQAGRLRAERYRWEEAARQSLEFFEGLGG
jgi:hypothetical protein